MRESVICDGQRSFPSSRQTRQLCAVLQFVQQRLRMFYAKSGGERLILEINAVLVKSLE